VLPPSPQEQHQKNGSAWRWWLSVLDRMVALSQLLLDSRQHARRAIWNRELTRLGAPSVVTKCNWR
jgi:hypothetical protein